MQKQTTIAFEFLECPLGTITIMVDERGVCGVKFGELDAQPGGSVRFTRDAVQCRDATTQINEYLYDGRRVFDLPLHYEGTTFQRAVWQALQAIPFGETRAYMEIAAEIGNPKAVRAVGQANRRNPLAIIIPCHRVLGKSGAMVGYDGSHTDRKEWLLRLEKAVSPRTETRLIAGD